jgi:hypothetical protein
MTQAQFQHIEDCLATLNDSGSPCWRIVKRHRKEGNNTFIFTSETRIETGEDESKDSLKQYIPLASEHLQTCILRLPPGMYVLKIFKNFSSNGLAKCVQEFDFDVPKPGYGNPIGPQQPFAIGAAPQNYVDMESKIMEKVNAKLNEIELARLKEENDQLRQMVEDPADYKKHIATAIGSINEHAPTFLPSLAMKVLGMFGHREPLGQVAGVQHLTYPGKAANRSLQDDNAEPETEQIEVINEDMTPEQQEIMSILDANNEAFSELLFRLINHDRDLVTTLTKLADKLDSGEIRVTLLKNILG